MPSVRNRQRKKALQSNDSSQVKARVFADEDTRIAWETLRRVLLAASALPPERPDFKPQAITFEGANRLEGLTAVLSAGTVIFTDRHVLLVPERTLEILQKLDIPYNVASSS